MFSSMRERWMRLTIHLLCWRTWRGKRERRRFRIRAGSAAEVPMMRILSEEEGAAGKTGGDHHRVTMTSRSIGGKTTMMGMSMAGRGMDSKSVDEGVIRMMTTSSTL